MTVPKTNFYKLYVISLVLILAHLGLNYFTNYSISIEAVLVFQMFYFFTMILAVFYMRRGIRVDKTRLWVNYMSIVSVKFFLFLAFVFGMKWFLELSKIEALIHVFLWFFIYLFVEVKFILKEIKEV